MLARGSGKFVLPFLIIGVALSYFIWWLGVPITLFGIYLAWFFRDPRRNVIQDELALLAPADGTVKYTEQSQEGVKIAIRMSPFDVHLNRSPMSGEIKKVQHQSGSHQSVYFAGAEDRNEQNLIVIENSDLVVEILQITGSFARRIECWVKIDDKVRQGEKIGIIRFGSQTNILIKSKDVEKGIKPIVTEGQSVRAGLTIVAKLEGV